VRKENARGSPFEKEPLVGEMREHSRRRRVLIYHHSGRGMWEEDLLFLLLQGDHRRRISPSARVEDSGGGGINFFRQRGLSDREEDIVGRNLDPWGIESGIKISSERRAHERLWTPRE